MTVNGPEAVRLEVAKDGFNKMIRRMLEVACDAQELTGAMRAETGSDESKRLLDETLARLDRSIGDLRDAGFWLTCKVRKLYPRQFDAHLRHIGWDPDPNAEAEEEGAGSRGGAGCT